MRPLLHLHNEKPLHPQIVNPLPNRGALKPKLPPTKATLINVHAQRNHPFGGVDRWDIVGGEWIPLATEEKCDHWDFECFGQSVEDG